MIGARLPLTPEQWEKVRDIYEKALNEPESRRSAEALRLCEGDSQLAAEVDLLLTASDRAGSFLGEPAVDALGCLTTPETRQDIVVGNILSGRFQILRFLDRGGMGEVYEAWDSDLREVVALKTIRPEIASEPAAIEYFKEEVKNARQIAHPNICRVYDLFSHAEDSGNRIWFLSMQFLEGQTLLEHLKEKGPFEVKEALPLIEQMVAGLSAAHALGVVHRDFKSANVMLVPTPGGALRAVVTDFGLATRATSEAGGKQGRRGQGTPVYVSPEQWFDGVAGSASDQYALGVVICEMVTGERPRMRPMSLESTLDADAGRSATVELPVGRKLEARWAAVVRRCLEPNPEDRFPTIDDVLVALDPVRRRRTTLRWIAALVVLPILAAALVLGVANADRPPVIAGLAQVTPAMSLSSNPSLSRDGKTIAYMSDRAESGNPDIWVQQLPDGTPVRITSDPSADDSPSISPDGRTVVFRSDRNHGGVYISDADGGGERLLVPEGRDPRFSPDGRSIVYWTGDDKEIVASGRIYRLDLAGGTPVQLATGFADARYPVWSSDGRHVLFTGCASGRGSIPSCWDWWVAGTDGSAPRNTGAMAILNGRQIRPMGAPGGWYGDAVLFSGEHASEVQLWRLNLSQESLTASGEPSPLASADALAHISSASLAQGDVLAFNQLSPAIHVWRIDHATTPKTATAHKVTQHAEFDFSPSVSANGRWLTFARGLGGDRSLWIRDTLTGREKLVPVDGVDKLVPITDDQGSTLVYESSRSGVPSIYLAKPGAPVERICTACRNPTGWLDGRFLLYSDAGMSEVAMYDTLTKESRTILSAPGASVGEATWSPQDRYILFTVSLHHANAQVFAARFPPGAKAPDRRWIAITGPTESTDKPRWSGDGRTIFYFSNRDSAWCIWGRHFDPIFGVPSGSPFPIQHYHSLDFSPAEISSRSLNLSVAGDSIYLNVAELNGTIWTGKITRKASFLHRAWF